MDFRKQTILVTGADGFIGSHLVETLVRQGYHVRATALYQALGLRGWLDHIAPHIQAQLDIQVGDLRDPYFVRNCVRGCAAVLHLAALIAIPYSYLAPAAYVENNILSTLHLLQAAKEFGIQKFIQTSTSEVYGSAVSIPMTEAHRLQAQSPYAATKIAADQLALSFFHAFQLPVVVLRPFNTYGPRQSTRAVIPSIIVQLATNQTDLKLGTLDSTRDFNYVTDTVAGFINTLCANNIAGEVIHLGTETEVSILTLAELIADIMQKPLHIATETVRLRPTQSEVWRLCADASNANQKINFQPHYTGLSGLRKGLEHTIDWFLDKNNLAHYHADRYQL